MTDQPESQSGAVRSDADRMPSVTGSGIALTSADLTAMRERVNAATPGPWTDCDRGGICGHGTGVIAEANEEWDADFIAKSRTDIPALLDLVDRYEKALREIRELILTGCARAPTKRIIDAALDPEVSE